MPTSMHQCSVCSKLFTRKDNLTRHQKIHGSNWLRCGICDFTSSRPDTLQRHLATYHKDPKADSKSVHHELDDHQAGSSGKDTSFKKRLNEVDELIQFNRKWIENSEHITTRYQDRYNFKIHNPTPARLAALLTAIFHRQTFSFRVNLSFGYILYNSISGEHEYFYASTNNRLFSKPITISCAEDISRFTDVIDTEDIVEFCKAQRENSRYVVERITNVLFYVNKLKEFYIGCSSVVLPDYILRKTSVITMVKNHCGALYQDNMCLFRCIAFHFHGSRFERKAKEMAEAYCRAIQMDILSFKGVTMEALSMVEKFFKVNIAVYVLKEEKDITGSPVITARKVRESRRIHPRTSTVNVNLYKNHFSYIRDLNQYARRWHCKKCTKLFRTKNDATVHERRCFGYTTFKYGNGGYGLSKTVFDLLLENGYCIEEELKFYNYRIAFDFESMSERLPVSDGNNKLEFVRRLIPASVSVCSNVPEYEQPRCFVSTGSVDLLISEMFEYMMEIQKMCYTILVDRYSDVLSWLRLRQDDIRALTEELTETFEHHRRQELTEELYRYKIFDQIAQQLETWIRRIPVLGFNSSHFDINLIRQHMFPYMLKNGIKINHIISKGNDYISITTDEFQFIDIKQFLSPGTSYAGWLKANDVSVGKGYWPYEWFENLEQLEQTELVSKECFYSTLKGDGVSDSSYKYLQDVWTNRGFRTMKDLLIWYNNLDTAPFLEAAQKMHDLWRALGIDAFKSNCISLPGLALQLLMKKIPKHTILPLLKEPDVFNLVKSNITGGLAVVMHRYHRVGETTLPNGHAVARIYSHDANALYLWALGEETGTGIYGIWQPHGSDGVPSMPWCRGNETASIMRWHDVKQTNGEVLFRRELSYRHMTSQIEWLEYTSFIGNIRIEHKFNGREKVIHISPDVHYPVDGFDPESHTVYQFHGCYWHGHGCEADKESDPDKRCSRRLLTRKIDCKIKELGYNLCVIWECEWSEQKVRNPEIKIFAEQHFQLLVKTNYLTGSEIVRLIERDGIFGMVECDIEVPWWDENLLSWYAEFPPIYKNTTVSKEDIGVFMRSYAEEEGFLKKPRRCLINSYWARKILLTTPLLKWYLSNGVVITKIYQIIEMKSKRCFEQLRDEIAHHRRMADSEPKLKPQGENWKLVGNSCYGKTVTNKNRHKDIKIVLDDEVGRYINDKRFSKMEEVGDMAYEVCMDKKTIKQDLPITIGFFVYNAAKLRMLQFIYDFLKKYYREGSYQIVCSDTDSIIAAYEDVNLDKLVKPELADEYHNYAKKLFLVMDSLDLRTPGLFKIELEATMVVALCSKTYFALNENDNSTKISSKGLSKKTNQFTVDDFTNVLTSKQRGSGTNHGLRMKGKEMMQYRQQRAGLSYLYIKRKVLSDGISTEPLDC